MTDLETRMREVMDRAVPEDLSSAGLADGARRYAARARRTRVATAALVTAVVVGAFGLASSGVFRDRAAVPATPSLVLNLCPELQQSLTRLTSPPRSPASATQKAVLVCAFTDGDSVWPGSLPPDAAVDAAAALDTLKWSLRGDPRVPCGDAPRGRAFTVTVLDHHERARTFPNTDLACDGWPFLSSYYVALSELGADWVAANEPKDPYPTCPSLLHEQSRPLARTSDELLRGTVFTSAAVCSHPVASPVLADDPAVPKPVFVRRGAMSDIELARLNANLTRTGAVRGAQPCRDRAPLNLIYVVRGVTSTGRTVSLTAHAACLPTFTVNNDPTFTITLDAATVDDLTGPQNRYP
jgi:hypothetical protein